VIESTTEISSLEGTSSRQTVSTSAHRVPNNLIADYGREKKIVIYGTAYLIHFIRVARTHAHTHICMYIA